MKAETVPGRTRHRGSRPFRGQMTAKVGNPEHIKKLFQREEWQFTVTPLTFATLFQRTLSSIKGVQNTLLLFRLKFCSDELDNFTWFSHGEGIFFNLFYSTQTYLHKLNYCTVKVPCTDTPCNSLGILETSGIHASATIVLLYFYYTPRPPIIGQCP